MCMCETKTVMDAFEEVLRRCLFPLQFSCERQGLRPRGASLTLCLFEGKIMHHLHMELRILVTIGVFLQCIHQMHNWSNYTGSATWRESYLWAWPSSEIRPTQVHRWFFIFYEGSSCKLHTNDSQGHVVTLCDYLVEPIKLSQGIVRISLTISGQNSSKIRVDSTLPYPLFVHSLS